MIFGHLHDDFLLQVLKDPSLVGLPNVSLLFASVYMIFKLVPEIVEISYMLVFGLGFQVVFAFFLTHLIFKILLIGFLKSLFLNRTASNCWIISFVRMHLIRWVLMGFFFFFFLHGITSSLFMCMCMCMCMCNCAYELVYAYFCNNWILLCRYCWRKQ